MFLICLSAVGEASDDRQREEEDHVLGHFSRHRHHMCRLVALRPHWPHGRGDQTRLATPTLHQPIKYYCTSHFLIQHRLPASPLRTIQLSLRSPRIVLLLIEQSHSSDWQLHLVLSDAYLDVFITYMQMVYPFFEIRVTLYGCLVLIMCELVRS